MTAGVSSEMRPKGSQVYRESGGVSGSSMEDEWFLQDTGRSESGRVGNGRTDGKRALKGLTWHKDNRVGVSDLKEGS